MAVASKVHDGRTAHALCLQDARVCKNARLYTRGICSIVYCSGYNTRKMVHMPRIAQAPPPPTFRSKLARGGRLDA
eukprot:11206675-Lingulodinium_polyedra.AAC.1